MPGERRARVLRRWIDAVELPPLPANGIAQIERELLHARQDAEAARAAMRLHLTNSRERLRQAHEAAEAEADPRGFLRKMLYSISGDAPLGNHWDKPLGATFLEGLPDVADPDGLPLEMYKV